MGEKVDFKRAYYIKLGEKGKYEQSAISESKLIIGYGGQSLQDINSGNWGKIGEQLGQASKGKKGVATKDLNVLRRICESTSEDLWITFSQEMMWWCRLGPKEVFQGDKSKATRKEFDYYAKQFNPKQPLRWFYFVVHSPNEELKALNNPWPNVKLIGPGQLSEMVVRLGLVDWLMSHIK